MIKYMIYKDKIMKEMDKNKEILKKWIKIRKIKYYKEKEINWNNLNKDIMHILIKIVGVIYL